MMSIGDLRCQSITIEEKRLDLFRKINKKRCIQEIYFNIWRAKHFQGREKILVPMEEKMKMNS